MNVCMSNDIFVGLTDKGTVRDWPLTTKVVTQLLGASFAKREAKFTNSHILIFSDIFNRIGRILSATMIDEWLRECGLALFLWVGQFAVAPEKLVGLELSLPMILLLGVGPRLVEHLLYKDSKTE